MTENTERRFIPYGRQSIDAADIEAMAFAMQSPIITRGATVEQFEHAVAQYCGAQFAVAFNSGSTALIAACHAAQAGKFDQVISTPNTFATTVNAAMRYGAKPILVDIDRHTGNLDLNQLEPILKADKRTRGKSIIIPVHFGGTAVDMQKLDSLICSPDTVVIEDAAHALGSQYPNGQRVGCCAWSQMTVFSFHPVKTITTGEGGMVLTNDPELYHRLTRFRNNGIERSPSHLTAPIEEQFEGYYEMQELANNYNFTDFQAALGLSQLDKIDRFIEKRQSLVTKYRELLKNVQHVTLFDTKQDHHTAFHILVAQIDFKAYRTDRKRIIEDLMEAGIGTQVHYIPVYRHPFFKNLYGEIFEQFPEMEKYYQEALTLPLYYDLQESDVEYVVDQLNRILVKNLQKNIEEETRQAYAKKGNRKRRYNKHSDEM